MSQPPSERPWHPTSFPLLRPKTAEVEEHRIVEWLHTSTYPTPPPSYANDIPPSEYVAQTGDSKDADYNWLIMYLTSTMPPVDEKVLRETVPKLEGEAVNTALIQAIAEILWLTEQLDERISFASAPALEVKVTNAVMYADRDGHWWFKAEAIRGWNDQEKVEKLQAARAETAWMRAECPRLQQVICDRYHLLMNQEEVEEVEEMEYVPSKRSTV